MSKNLQDIVGQWGEQTFPNSTLESIAAHLTEEVEEVSSAVYYAPGEGRQADDVIAEESADCYLLLLHLAHRIGFDLNAAARQKFARNQRRTWHDDGRGYAKHVEDQP